MNKAKIYGLLLTLLLLAACAPKNNAPNILPKPNHVEMGHGLFQLNETTALWSNMRLEDVAIFQKMMPQFTLADKRPSANYISFELIDDTAQFTSDEAYKIVVRGSYAAVTARNIPGLFYGLQSLLQSFNAEGTAIPVMTIVDAPRFEWRGLHLDVGRHFFSVDDVKTYIDLMARYKLNRFHWHLTEDQGWRIEIKKYPKLTAVGAWRKNVGFKYNQEKGFNVNDGSPYGGFYTQDEIRDVVAYAKERNIVVVPEIEIPGHAQAAVTAYPELYCFPNENLELRLEGGVSDGVYCAGKELTFTFLEDVLSEVIDLFPSEYIHIGGDEAPKNNWRRCPNCQKRIATEGLHDELELQSYTIKRIEKFVNAKGRKIIGWDEIMEGGLSSTAAVMAWRSTAPGVEAAELGNKVVMTPGNPCYLDAVQSINDVTKADEGANCNTLRDLYEFNPIPTELPAEFAHNIMGVQACSWTEYTPNLPMLLYKSYPRAIALAEIAWSNDSDKNWDDFYARIQTEKKYFDARGIRIGDPSYDVRIEIEPSTTDNKTNFKFRTEVPGDIYYTLDGTEPTRQSPVYTGPTPIDSSITISARMFKPDGTPYRVTSQDIFLHKAFGKKAIYATPYSSKHHGGGEMGLTNGQLRRWQGFEKRDLEVTVDMGGKTMISKIETNWLYDIGDWVFRPIEVTYEISSDNVHFEEVFRFTYNTPVGDSGRGVLPLVKNFDQEVAVNYIRLRAKGLHTNPHWHGSAGAPNWIFVDELIVE